MNPKQCKREDVTGQWQCGEGRLLGGDGPEYDGEQPGKDCGSEFLGRGAQQVQRWSDVCGAGQGGVDGTR